MLTRPERGSRQIWVPAAQALLGTALAELGYPPVGFTSSSAALAGFRAEPERFDALVTDGRMPGISGWR